MKSESTPFDCVKQMPEDEAGKFPVQEWPNSKHAEKERSLNNDLWHKANTGLGNFWVNNK